MIAGPAPPSRISTGLHRTADLTRNSGRVSRGRQPFGVETVPFINGWVVPPFYQRTVSFSFSKQKNGAISQVSL